MINKPVQFHWLLVQGGETKGFTRAQQLEVDAVAYPEVEVQAAYSNKAGALGYESLLVDFSYGKPDSLMMSAGIAPFTKKIKFLVAIKSNMSNPTYFTQQVNTFSSMFQGRILLNVVAGHSPKEQGYYGDFLPHDERYARTEEFLAVCNKIWHTQKPFDFEGKYFQIKKAQLRTKFKSPDRKAPFIFIAGGSKAAIELAIRQGDCWMRLADTPEKVKAAAKEVLASGKEVGLRLSIVMRETKEAAIAAAHKIVYSEVGQSYNNKENKFVQNTDSVSMKKMYEMSNKKEWLTPCLWTGAVRTRGASAICLVGTPKEIAQTLMEYKEAGVTQFIMSGWPTETEMVQFGKKVIPLVRVLEERKKSMWSTTKIAN